MVGGGYGQITARLAEGLDIRLSTPVADVRHDADGVVVETKDGEKIEGASVIVTVPLGCLKAGDITFSPPLGEMKSSAVQRLGFGNLNKVVLEFDEAFWDQSIDYFGSAIDSEENRGRSFMFWNLVPVSGKPMLISLIAGEAAKFAEAEGSESIVASVLAPPTSKTAVTAPGVEGEMVEWCNTVASGSVSSVTSFSAASRTACWRRSSL